jgi:hypothetical protein
MTFLVRQNEFLVRQKHRAKVNHTIPDLHLQTTKEFYLFSNSAKG